MLASAAFAALAARGSGRALDRPATRPRWGSIGGRLARRSGVRAPPVEILTMLRIYDDAVQLVRLLRPLCDKIGRHNRALRKQLEAAGPSVVCNIGEGHLRRGGHQTERFETAAGSARECRAALHVAIAAGYLSDDECDEALDIADKIAATLWRCTHGR